MICAFCDPRYVLPTNLVRHLFELEFLLTILITQTMSLFLYVTRLYHNIQSSLPSWEKNLSDRSALALKLTRKENKSFRLCKLVVKSISISANFQVLSDLQDDEIALSLYKTNLSAKDQKTSFCFPIRVILLRNIIRIQPLRKPFIEKFTFQKPFTASAGNVLVYPHFKSFGIQVMLSRKSTSLELCGRTDLRFFYPIMVHVLPCSQRIW